MSEQISSLGQYAVLTVVTHEIVPKSPQQERAWSIIPQQPCVVGMTFADSCGIVANHQY